MTLLLANLPEFDIMKVIFGGDYMHYKRVELKVTVKVSMSARFFKVSRFSIAASCLNIRKAF